MLTNLKDLIKGQKKKFGDLCRVNNLNLNYKSNINEFNVLKSIFESREYADYFPFYQNVNIIDIGSHLGYFSLFAANNTGKSSKIIAIEPAKNNYEKLQQNMKDCGISNVKSYHAAIGGHSGKLKLFHGASVNHSMRQDYALLDQANDFEIVDVLTLEMLINENKLDKIDFLKMDCEGSEYDILENLPADIFDRILTISMEFHDLKDGEHTGEGLIRILKNNRFDVVKYHYDATTMNLNYGKIIATKLLQ